MKLIIAIIQAEHLEAVESALNRLGTASLLSISQVFGSNREPGYGEIYRGTVVFRRRPRFRLEIYAQDSDVDTIVEEVARVGSHGECKAIVIDLGESAYLHATEREHAEPSWR
jgi:nitrogen regulatory protein PII